MEYEWNIEKIRYQRRQTLDSIIKTEGLTKDEKKILWDEIFVLTDMENILLHKKRFYFPHSTNYIDSSHLISTQTYSSYINEIPSDIKKIILGATKCFQNYTDTYQEISLPKLELTDQELVFMSYDFFKWLNNDKYLKDFKKYANPNNHLIHFNRDYLDSTIGITNYFYFPTYRPYISIDRNNDINDFITLNHEMAHGIMFKNDNTKSLNSSHYFLTELEGSFFDFLSIQYLKDFYSEDIINDLEYNRFITMYDSFISFYVTDAAIKLFEKKKKISIIPIQNKILKQELPFYLDESVLLSSLQEDIKDTAKYLISYLTSLDLESIYEKDREYSLYLFENIRNFKNKNLFQNLVDNNISFIGDNDNYDTFQKVIKKMNMLGK